MVRVIRRPSHEDNSLESNQIKSSLFLISTSTFNKGSLTIRHTHEGSNRKGGVYLAGLHFKKENKRKCVIAKKKL